MDRGQEDAVKSGSPCRGRRDRDDCVSVNGVREDQRPQPHLKLNLVEVGFPGSGLVDVLAG